MASGCSAIFVDRKTVVPTSQGLTVECTESRVAPVMDAVLTVVYPVLGGTAAIVCPSWGELEGNCPEVFIASAVVSGLHLMSSIYGFRATGQCRAAKENVRDPMAGKPDRRCRVLGEACDAGLACVQERCVPVPPPVSAPPPGTLGRPCTGGVPGVPTSGRCEKPLLCRDYVCVEP